MNEFRVNDEVEQAYRQGYSSGYADGKLGRVSRDEFNNGIKRLEPENVPFDECMRNAFHKLNEVLFRDEKNEINK